MALTERSSEIAAEIFRNRTNQVAGLVLQVMMIGVWILGDPAEVHIELPPEESLGPALATVVTGALGLIAVLSLAIWWYPTVVIDDDVVTVRNPFRVHRIPRSAIEEVLTNGAYVRIKTVHRTIWCAGLERSLAMAIAADSTDLTGRFSQAVRTAEHDEETAVSSSMRRPTGLEIAVATGWVLLTLATPFLAP